MLAIWMLLTLVMGAVAATVLRGLVLAQLWKWFIVPAFGLPQISIPLAIGLSVILNYFLVTKNKREDKDEKMNSEQLAEGAVKAITAEVVAAFFVLLVGWIISLFL